MTKYLKNGQEVSVVREVDGGYLYQPVFYGYDYEDDFVVDDTLFFADKLYDTPPMEKFHKDVNDLHQEIDIARKELSDVKDIKNKEKSLLAKIKERDFVQCLVDYLNKDFEYLLSLNHFDITHKDKIYHSPYIKILSTKNNGFKMYKLRNNSYDSYDDFAVMPFKTLDEAKEYAANKITEKLIFNTEESNYPWSAKTIKSHVNDIHYSCEIKKNETFMALYEAKIKEANERDAKNKREKLEKEILKRQQELKEIL